MAASPEAVLHLAALHTLAQAGFASTSRAASLTLTGVLQQYLSVVAATCTERAALAGRSKVAAVDVVHALEDMGVGSVSELQEWTADLDKEVSFAGGKMEELTAYLRDGLSISEITDLRYAPIEDEEDEDEDDGDSGIGEDEEESAEEEDVKMDVDEIEAEQTAPRISYRPRSPDMSWLPPLPTESALPTAPGAAAIMADTTTEPQSIVDRYRQPISYNASQLRDTHPWADPPKAPVDKLPVPTSSFQSLVHTYAATEKEPSVALRQTDGRRQAADAFRLAIGNPEVFSPMDTLAVPVPPPHVSPIVPSHNESLPPRLLPVNPNRNGIITSLIHTIRTPYLRRPLLERLTSLRPPQPQSNDQGPVLYGEPVRGADDAALAKARGKAIEDETECWFQATWDSGPKGAERARGRLPTGRKVVKAVEGAVAPRTAADVKPLRVKLPGSQPQSTTDTSAPTPVSSKGIKLRLSGRKSPEPSEQRGADAAWSADSRGRSGYGGQPTKRPGSANSHRSKSRSTSRSVSPVKRTSLSPVKQEYN